MVATSRARAPGGSRSRGGAPAGARAAARRSRRAPACRPAAVSSAPGASGSPSSSRSSSSPRRRAAQSTTTNGPSRRGPSRWIDSAAAPCTDARLAGEQHRQIARRGAREQRHRGAHRPRRAEQEAEAVVVGQLELDVVVVLAQLEQDLRAAEREDRPLAEVRGDHAEPVDDRAREAAQVADDRAAVLDRDLGQWNRAIVLSTRWKSAERCVPITSRSPIDTTSVLAWGPPTTRSRNRRTRVLDRRPDARLGAEVTFGIAALYALCSTATPRQRRVDPPIGAAHHATIVLYSSPPPYAATDRAPPRACVPRNPCTKLHEAPARPHWSGPAPVRK